MTDHVEFMIAKEVGLNMSDELKQTVENYVCNPTKTKGIADYKFEARNEKELFEVME